MVSSPRMSSVVLARLEQSNDRVGIRYTRHLVTTPGTITVPAIAAILCSRLYYCIFPSYHHSCKVCIALDEASAPACGPTHTSLLSCSLHWPPG